MKLSRRLSASLGILLFSVGFLLGTALFGGLVWADFEVVLFDPAWRDGAPLRSLRCPILLTPAETGVVSARVSNPLDRPTERYVRVHMSAGSLLLTREFTEVVPLDPGESERVEWSVSADDTVFDRFVMVNVVLRSRYPLPARQGTCGILVLDVPYLTGPQVFGLTLTASLLTMAAGCGLWIWATPPLSDRRHQPIRAMVALAGSVLVGILLGVLGWWLPGLILLTIVLIGIGVIIGYVLNRA